MARKLVELLQVSIGEAKRIVDQLITLHALDLIQFSSTPMATIWSVGNTVIALRRLTNTACELTLLVARKEDAHIVGDRVGPDSRARAAWNLLGEYATKLKWTADFKYVAPPEKIDPDLDQLIRNDSELTYNETTRAILISAARSGSSRRDEAAELEEARRYIEAARRKRLQRIESGKASIAEEELQADRTPEEVAAEYLDALRHVDFDTKKPILGRRRDADYDWAYKELSDGRPREKVYKDWVKRIGRRMDKLVDPRGAFNHAMSARERKARQSR